MPPVASAHLGRMQAHDLLAVTHDLSVLDGRGRWAVALPYDGEPVCARFGEWTANGVMDHPVRWTGPGSSAAWSTSMDEADYRSGVEWIRAAIAEGRVYQANLCRILSAALPDPSAADVAALWRLLDAGNPSPYGGYLHLPDHDVAVATASPELFVSLRAGEAGRIVRSGPIKGTGRTREDLTDKDVAENVMIVDLVRNDLSRVSRPGSVFVPELLEVEQHPGLVHLVSYVEGSLVPEAGWPALIDATFPPGSVTGAPKIAALDIIARLERAPREFYCGAIGWVDADTGEAELAVSIRTFWVKDGEVRFGTGAGITWGSDAEAEWRETELKAARLISIASGSWQGGPS